MNDSDTDLGSIAIRRTLEAGEILCREGERGNDVYQIVSGSLDVVCETDGMELKVATQAAGDIVGEIASALGGKRTATLRAAEPSAVDVIDFDAFAQWRDRNPASAAALAERAHTRYNRLRSVQVLSRLLGHQDTEVIDNILQHVTWRTLHPGEVLFRQGDDTHFAAIVVTGRLSVTAVDADGETTVDLELGRAELVGEMGIIEEAPRSATVEAIRDTTLAVVSREVFHELTTAYPGLMLQIFRSVLQRLTRTHRPDSRARVVALAVTAPTGTDGIVDAFVDAVQPFGSALHLHRENLGRFVGGADAADAPERIDAFMRYADVAHDYVIHLADPEMSDWSRRALRQCDRLVIVSSANPDADEQARVDEFVQEMGAKRRDAVWLARLHPAYTSRARGSGAARVKFAVEEVHNIRIGCTADFERLGRLATGNGRGVVLGGGGARGIAHIGALRALAESGILPDRIAGASMGSVVAGFAAEDRNAKDLLELATRELTDLLDFTIPFVSLITGKKMTAGMSRNWGTSDIEDFWIPFFCVSTNLTTSELAIHRTGPVVRAVRASVAIPGVLPPVPIDGDLHVDGGVLDNVPVGTMRDDSSIGTVIALDVSPPDGPRAKEDFGLTVTGVDALKRKIGKNGSAKLPEMATILMSSMVIASSQSRRTNLDSDAADLYISMNTSGFGLLKFENHAAIEQRGYEHAKPQVEEWLARANPRPAS